MALEPITRQEKIIAGQDLTPITRLEKFLKDFGGGGSGLPSGGEPYQQLVTDEGGNAKWTTVNSTIYRNSDGNLSVDSCMEINGSPAPIEYMMRYGAILFVDDANGTYSPCISACENGSGYVILTFMSIGESSSTTIKIKVAGGILADDKISIIGS